MAVKKNVFQTDIHVLQKHKKTCLSGIYAIIVNLLLLCALMTAM